MTTVDDIAFSLEQTEEQRTLKLVRVEYAYTLDRTNDGSEGESDTFAMSIDILGDDPLIDDELALDVDTHEVTCAPGQSVRNTRALIVGQSLLDEDIGTDEIKLKVKAKDGHGDVIAVMTPIIRGDF